MSELRTATLEVDNDTAAVYELSLAEKWGDGAPVVPPTRERVLAMLAETPRDSAEIVAMLPPRRGGATVELLAINAVMAGCTPRMFPLVIAAIEALAEPGYNGFALATTTAPVTPYLIVNGPTRDELQFDYRAGCLGGAAGRGSVSVGRAVALCLRNIGGLRAGDTSRSVLGQPARFGMCFAEWEERSEWPSLALRRGFQPHQEVITVHGGMGIIPLVDVNTDDDRELAHLIAKTLAMPMTNLYVPPVHRRGEVIVVLNPMWAERFGASWPKVEDLQSYLHEHAWQPADVFPTRMRKLLGERGRIDGRGRVHAATGPQQIVPIVAGGLGNLHSAILMTFGETLMQSAAALRAGGPAKGGQALLQRRAE